MGGPRASLDGPNLELSASTSATVSRRSPTTTTTTTAIAETQPSKPSEPSDTASASHLASPLPTAEPPLLSPSLPIRRAEQGNADAVAQDATSPRLDHHLNTRIPSLHIRTPSRSTPKTPSGPGLHILTDIGGPWGPTRLSQTRHASEKEQSADQTRSRGDSSARSPHLVVDGTLFSKTSASSMYAASQIPPSPASSLLNSPALNALADITPLPSPLPTIEDLSRKRTHSREGSAGSVGRSLREEVLLDQAGAGSVESPSAKISPTKMKPKAYGNLVPVASDPISSQRSRSEFRPEPMHNERQRHVTVGTDGAFAHIDSALHREKYLAERRGLIQSSATSAGVIPTPPPSNRSTTSEGDEARDDAGFVEYLAVREGYAKTKRKYRTVRPLGQGTFSKVVLGTSERIPTSNALDEGAERWLNPRNLVAIKIVQHGPAGGADADRIDLGLKREIEILKMLDHPTLIHLKAFDFNEHEALIVLNYCAGGDLFDLASQHRSLLTPLVVRRIFSEMVDALRYLHSHWIVHRDIKLENVLLNPTPSSLAAITDPLSHPYPLITLTDLGLSREVPKPPDSPYLTTRCGSEDYAAPEILLGQPYDGRQTDAWALGVLTYALVEGRLPFDIPPARPGSRINRRGRTTHRIARCDWIWYEYGDDDGEWDPVKGAAWEGAREAIESLLKKVTRGRLSLDQLADKPYVKKAIPESGLRRPPHADDEE